MACGTEQKRAEQRRADSRRASRGVRCLVIVAPQPRVAIPECNALVGEGRAWSSSYRGRGWRRHVGDGNRWCITPTYVVS